MNDVIVDLEGLRRAAEAEEDAAAAGRGEAARLRTSIAQSR